VLTGDSCKIIMVLAQPVNDRGPLYCSFGEQKVKCSLLHNSTISCQSPAFKSRGQVFFRLVDAHGHPVTNSAVVDIIACGEHHRPLFMADSSIAAPLSDVEDASSSHSDEVVLNSPPCEMQSEIAVPAKVEKAEATEAHCCAPTVLIDEHALEEHFKCTICLGALRDPVKLECKHTFCQGCLADAYMSQSCQDSCPLCRHKQSLHPGLHKQLPTLGSFVGNLVKAPRMDYVDPASIEKEGFIFPENYLSSDDREKAMAYRKQYRSWRTKAGHGSHGEFAKVVDLTPVKASPTQLPLLLDSRPAAEEHCLKDLKGAGNNAKRKLPGDEFWALSEMINSSSPQLDAKSPDSLKRMKLNFSSEDGTADGSDDDALHVLDDFMISC